jgi:hypothetical protein
MRSFITACFALGLLLQAGVESRLLEAQAARPHLADENDLYVPIALQYKAQLDQDLSRIDYEPTNVAPVDPQSPDDCRETLRVSREVVPASEHPLFAFMSLQP